MLWKVWKLMPSGSTISHGVACPPSSRSMFDRRKLKYLKNPRNARLADRLPIRISFRFAGACTRSSQMPAV